MLKQALITALLALPGLAGLCRQTAASSNAPYQKETPHDKNKTGASLQATDSIALLKGEKAEALLEAYAKLNQFNGTALVASHGKIILQKEYGWRNVVQQAPNDENSIYQAASITKTFTGTLVMKLAEMKKLSLEDKLSKYYPGYPKGDSITIAHLLSHTSGIYNYTMNGDFMNQKSTLPATEEEILALFRDVPLDFSPGTGWNYSNSGYMLLGYIIQKVTGLPYETAIRKYIFAPLGMQHSGFDFAHLRDKNKTLGYAADSTGAWAYTVPSTDSSVSFAAGSIYLTAGDLFKWHQGLTKYAIVSPAGWQEISTRKRENYGFGWIIDSLQGQRTVGHSGGMRGFRTNFIRVPEDDACIILLSNSETMALEAITQKLLAILYDKPYQLPANRTAIKLDTVILKRYTGTYLLAEKNLKVHIVLENGELAAYPERGPRSSLCATSPSCFFLKEDTDFETCFITDATGKGVKLMINKNGRTGVANRVEE
ncbi:serine hydrolase domain-containing protein [Chitinophaga barathri]|uniref:Class A beta-lactamase-related serine hydrolase n=1 Tax=Chitinophaga barathri TaxID=1647451 RepID=A0A3N4MBQ1_9BACT|nr:serine hydrolase domain-containing protein [Chitinophaga barathri]RPD39226.1 class A beta-lactamase-related serine hydrolase [Chitinophaga barathri]